MKWNEINHTHHGLTVEVRNPRPPWEKVMGRVRCPKQGVLPVLVNGAEKIYSFAWWYEVDIID